MLLPVKTHAYLSLSTWYVPGSRGIIHRSTTHAIGSVHLHREPGGSVPYFNIAHLIQHHTVQSWMAASPKTREIKSKLKTTDIIWMKNTAPAGAHPNPFPWRRALVAPCSAILYTSTADPLAAGVRPRITDHVAWLGQDRTRVPKACDRVRT